MRLGLRFPPTCSNKRSFRLCVCSSKRSTYSRSSSISSFTCWTVSNSCLIITMSLLTFTSGEEEKRESNEKWIKRNMWRPQKVAQGRTYRSTYFRNFALAAFNGFGQLLELRANLAQCYWRLHVSVSLLQVVQFTRQVHAHYADLLL